MVLEISLRLMHNQMRAHASNTIVHDFMFFLHHRWCFPPQDPCLLIFGYFERLSLCAAQEKVLCCAIGRCVEVKELAEPQQPFSFLATTPAVSI